MENFNNDKGLQTMAHALIGRQDHICIDITIRVHERMGTRIRASHTHETVLAKNGI